MYLKKHGLPFHRVLFSRWINKDLWLGFVYTLQVFTPYTSPVVKMDHDATFLEDGFSEFAIYEGHKLPVKGIVQVDEPSLANPIDQFITWDMKQTHFWKVERASGQVRPHKVLKFSSERPHFVVAVTYIHKMHMFLFATEDLAFKLYDRELNLIESIRHQERHIAALDYLAKDDCVVISGARGVSVWKVYRKIVSSSQSSYVFEKLFAFTELSLVWVSKISYETSSNFIYAFVENSVFTLSLEYRRVAHRLDHIHDTPVTACIWYARSQMFLTGCQRGEIKCMNETKALLHEFKIHSGAVTSLAQHPTPGLAISTSLDGHIKTLNLENYTVIFDINVQKPILHMKTMPYTRRCAACVFPLNDGTIYVWKLSSCADYFGALATNVRVLLHAELSPGYVQYRLWQQRQQQRRPNRGVVTSKAGGADANGG